MPDDTPLNTLPADALFTLALTGADEEESWSAITQLHRVATEAVFTDAARLCRSSNPHDRRVGVDVLAQLGLPENTFHEQVMHVLFALLETEEAPEVLASIGSACGHRMINVPSARYWHFSSTWMRMCATAWCLACSVIPIRVR